MDCFLSNLPVSQQQLLLPLLKLKQDVGRDNISMLCDLFETFAKAIDNFSNSLKELQHRADSFHKIVAAGTVQPDVSQAITLIRGDQYKFESQEYNTTIVASTTAEQPGLLSVWSGIGALFGSMHFEFERLHSILTKDVIISLKSLKQESDSYKTSQKNDPLGGVANFIPSLQMMALNGKYTNSKVQKSISHVLKSHESLQECIVSENEIVNKVKTALASIGIDTEGFSNIEIKECANSHLDHKICSSLSSVIKHTLKAKDNLGKHLKELFALAPELRQFAKSSDSTESTTVVSLDQIGYQVSNAQNCPSDVATKLVNEFTDWEINRLSVISRSLQIWVKTQVECEQKNYSPLVKLWNSLCEDFSPLGDFNSFLTKLVGEQVESVRGHSRAIDFADSRVISGTPGDLESIDRYSFSNECSEELLVDIPIAKREESVHYDRGDAHISRGDDVSISDKSTDRSDVIMTGRSSQVEYVDAAEASTGRDYADLSEGSIVSDIFVTARNAPATFRTAMPTTRSMITARSDISVIKYPTEKLVGDPSLQLPLHELNEIKQSPISSPKPLLKEVPIEEPPEQVEEITFREYISKDSGTFSASLIANLSKPDLNDDNYLYNLENRPDVTKIEFVSHVPLAEYYLETSEITNVDDLLKEKQKRFYDYFENLLNTSLYTKDFEDIEKWSDWEKIDTFPPSKILQRHDLYPIFIEKPSYNEELKPGRSSYFGIYLNDYYMDNYQWEVGTLETLLLIYRFLDSYINHPLMYKKFDSHTSKVNKDAELQIFLLANVGLFEHCKAVIRQLVELLEKKTKTESIASTIIKSLICSRDSFQSNTFDENSFTIHPFDVRYRIALLIDSWNKDDIKIGSESQSIYEFPDFYKWCYRQLHIVHISIALKLWRLVRYSPKFGASTVEKWDSIISGGNDVGNFMELFDLPNSTGDSFFYLAKTVSSLLLKAIRLVNKLKIMYVEHLDPTDEEASQVGKSNLLKLLELMSKVYEIINDNGFDKLFFPEEKHNEEYKEDYNFVCDVQVYADENLSLLYEWGFLQSDNGCLANCFCRCANVDRSNDKKKPTRRNSALFKLGSANPKTRFFTKSFEGVRLSQFWALEEPIVVKMLYHCYSVVPINPIGTEASGLSRDSPMILQAILIASSLLQTGVSPNLFVLDTVHGRVRPETRIPLLPLCVHSLLLYNHVFNQIRSNTSISTCWEYPRIILSLYATINSFEKLISFPTLLPIELYTSNSALETTDEYVESSSLSSFKAFKFVTSSLLDGLNISRNRDFSTQNNLDSHHLSHFLASRYEKDSLTLFTLRILLGEVVDSGLGNLFIYLDPFFIKANNIYKGKIFRNKKLLIDTLPIQRSISKNAIHNLVEANVLLELERNEFLKSNLTLGEKFEKMSKIIGNLFDKGKRIEKIHKNYEEFVSFTIDFYQFLSMLVLPYLKTLEKSWKTVEIVPCTDKLFSSFKSIFSDSNEKADLINVKQSIVDQFSSFFRDKFLAGLAIRLDSVLTMVTQAVLKDDFISISPEKDIYYSYWASDLLSLIRHTISICFKFSAPVEWLISPIFELAEKVISKYINEIFNVLKAELIIENGCKISKASSDINEMLQSEDFDDHLLVSEKIDSNFPSLNTFMVSYHNFFYLASELNRFELDGDYLTNKEELLVKAARNRVFKISATALDKLQNAIAWRIILELVRIGGSNKLNIIIQEFGLLCERILDSLPEDMQKTIYIKAYDSLIYYVSYIVKRDLENGNLYDIANKGETTNLLSAINSLCIEPLNSNLDGNESSDYRIANLIIFINISLNTTSSYNTEKKKHPKFARLRNKVIKGYEAIMSGRQSQTYREE